MAIPTRFFRLRWCFDFADKPTRRGIWDMASEAPGDKACFIRKDGLVRASIEGECLQNHELVTLFECDGHDYVSVNGEAYGRMPMLIAKNGVRAKLEAAARPVLYGMSFLTRELYVTVYRNGALSKRPLSAQEKRFQLIEHS